MDTSNLQKVVLVIPNTNWYNRRPWMISNNCAFVLTALLKDDYDFSILDANGSDMSKAEVKRQLLDLKPDAVLVSGVSIEYRKQYHAVFSIARQADPDVITILGGSYCTLLPEDAIKDDPNLSYVFIGHAEERLGAFMEKIFAKDPEVKNIEGVAFRDENGRIRINPLSKKVVQLKELRDLDYSYMDLSPYLDQEHMDFMANGPGKTFMLMSSRGCPHNCVFCANKNLQGRGLVFYSAEKVLSDMEYLIATYDVNHFIFIDDLFLYDRDRVDEIIRGISALRKKYPGLTWHHANVSAWHLDPELLSAMKESGCDKIIISIESGSKRVLSKIIRKPLKLDIIPGVVKMCREAGMDIGANFVIGLPGETWEEIRQTFAFADELNLDLAHFHIATPQPGTDLYKMSVDGGYLPPDFSFLDERFFGYCEGFIETDEFTPQELKVLRAYEWDRINFSTPQKIKKAAQMYMTLVDKLNEHRRQTRRKLGVHVNKDERGINRL
ncbi:MAG: radical SAM protein [Desulfobacteraceae bacterium]|nr:radical SAM protein [Desulfobacteraceae bacterium]